MKIIYPVCGIELEEETVFAQSEHEGQLVNFNSQERIINHTIHIAEPCAPYPATW